MKGTQQPSSEQKEHLGEAVLQLELKSNHQGLSSGDFKSFRKALEEILEKKIWLLCPKGICFRHNDEFKIFKNFKDGRGWGKCCIFEIVFRRKDGLEDDRQSFGLNCEGFKYFLILNLIKMKKDKLLQGLRNCKFSEEQCKRLMLLAEQAIQRYQIKRDLNII